MIELKDAAFFKSGVEAISSFIPEGNFGFNDKGVHFRAIDPSQILLVDFFVDKKLFGSYSIEPCFIGVNILELGKILARALPSDSITIDITDSELLVSLSGELERSFRLPLIDVSDEELKLPESGYGAHIEINSRLLKEALKDASLFSSSVVIRTKGDKFFLDAKGSAGTLNSSSQSKGVKVVSKEDVVSKYSLNFLQNLIREADADSIVALELKSDAPMKVSYKIGASEIRFYLAHMLL